MSALSLSVLLFEPTNHVQDIIDHKIAASKMNHIQMQFCFDGNMYRPMNRKRREKKTENLSSDRAHENRYAKPWPYVSKVHGALLSHGVLGAFATLRCCPSADFKSAKNP
jgi:hypothetical protein